MKYQMRTFVCSIGALFLAMGCAKPRDTRITQTGVQYETVQPGAGPIAQAGHTVTIHETMSLADGKEIFSTRTAGKPVTFVLGGGQVIAGIEEVVTGMAVGEKRKAIIPPEQSKRSDYPANVPPDATLFYDIELIEIAGSATP
jgi:FKBP-type peptidyl-prolyl cis-trans isomerase